MFQIVWASVHTELNKPRHSLVAVVADSLNIILSNAMMVTTCQRRLVKLTPIFLLGGLEAQGGCNTFKKETL